MADSFIQRRLVGTLYMAGASKAPLVDEETAAPLRKHRKLSLLQSKISKVGRAARMAGGSLHAGDANAARRKPSSSFVANFKDETSGRELIIPWAHGKGLEQLKRMVMKEFGHTEAHAPRRPTTPHRTACQPHRTAPHRAAPHHTAPHRTRRTRRTAAPPHRSQRAPPLPR